MSYHKTMQKNTTNLIEKLANKPCKIVIVRASRIGDFLCAVPAFRALRCALPQAEFSIITLPLLRDLVERSPYFDKYIEFPGYPGIAEQFFEARRATEFFRQRQLENYDLALQMQGSGVYSNPFTLLLGAKQTAGFIREGDGRGLLDVAAIWQLQAHEVRRNLALPLALGVDLQGEDLEFPLWPDDYAAADVLLAGLKRPIFGLHPSARDLTRRWPLERFVAVGRELLQKYGGSVVIVGEPSDCEAFDEMARQIGENCLNLAGQTSLVVLGAVISRLDLFVTNDTGPAHIAYALKKPSVVIFGSADPRLNGPLGDGPYRILAHPVACRPCGLGECPIGYQCLDGVSVEAVVAAATQLLIAQEANS